MLFLPHYLLKVNIGQKWLSKRTPRNHRRPPKCNDQKLWLTGYALSCVQYSGTARGFIHIYIYIYIWSCGGSEWYIMTRRSHIYIHIHIEIFWISESDHAEYSIIHLNTGLVVHSPSNILPFPVTSTNKFWGRRSQNLMGTKTSLMPSTWAS